MTEPACIATNRSPSEPALLRDARAGLARTPRRLPSKYFYDRRGSELFERITRLPEYYLTRAEWALLVAHGQALVDGVRPASLVELGAGSAAKTRCLLEAMLRRRPRGTYVPVDVSREFLAETASALTSDYGNLEVVPVVADITQPLELPRLLPAPALFALLGSTIGNFDTDEATVLLREIRAAMRPQDRLLIGFDLVKEPLRLHAAYNDAEGITAAFNRNILAVLNRELGADFDPEAFAHVAFYDAGRRRIEMHLEATRPMRVHVPQVGDLTFRRGERIMTEISGKYTEESVRDLFDRSGLSLAQWLCDGDFALAVASRAGAGGT